MSALAELGIHLRHTRDGNPADPDPISALLDELERAALSCRPMHIEGPRTFAGAADRGRLCHLATAMSAPAEFDNGRLPVLAAADLELRSFAADANDAHQRARDAASEAVAWAIRAGQALIAAKELVQHGEWLPWAGGAAMSAPPDRAGYRFNSKLAAAEVSP